MSNAALKIALTGASGHLGFVLHRLMMRRNIDHCLFLRRSDNRFAGAETVTGDQLEKAEALKLTRGCTTVIHSAAIVWPKKGSNRQVVETNTRLTKTLYDASIENGVQHFIYISSIHSMQVAPADRTMDESEPLITDNRYPYNFSKAESERYLSDAADIRTTIVNPTALFGPGDFSYHGFNQFFRRIEKGRMPFTVSGGYDVLDIRDAAHSIIEAAIREVPGKFMLSGKWHSMEELADRFAAMIGRKGPRGKLPAAWMRALAAFTIPVEYFRNRPLAFNTYAVETLLEGHRNISSEKAVQQLGHRVRPLEESLTDLHTWMQRQEMNAL